ncbi:TPA: hypothetical protein ACGO1T_001376, partial [Streptococcus suis]
VISGQLDRNFSSNQFACQLMNLLSTLPPKEQLFLSGKFSAKSYFLSEPVSKKSLSKSEENDDRKMLL